MATYELMLRLKGPAGEVVAAATPPTFDADTLKEALGLLALAEFPDNNQIKTIGLTLRRVTDTGVANGPGFTTTDKREAT